MMNYLRLVVVLVVLLWTLPAPVFAEFDFSLMVDDLNIAARSDKGRFGVEVAAEFGVTVGKVERLVATLGSHGDAYLCLKIGKLSGRSVDDVVYKRRSSPGKGWGKIAQSMGIKPGSDEFMQLKQKPGKKQKKTGKDKNKSKNKKNK